MAKMVTVDTRSLSPGIRLGQFAQFVDSNEFGGQVDSRQSHGAHVYYGRTLAGTSAVLGLMEIADPSVVYFKGCEGPETLTITLTAGHAYLITEGKRQNYRPGIPLVASGYRATWVHTTARTRRYEIKVRRSDLQLGNDEIERVLANELCWKPWQTELIVRNSHAMFPPGLDRIAQLDSEGVDRYIAGLAEMLLRSALDKKADERPSLAKRREIAVAFIRANLFKDTLNCEAVANHQGISVRQLSRSFCDGPSLGESISQIRLEQADKYLRTSHQRQYTITEISTMLDFSSPQHFSRVYKAHYGMTPTEARNPNTTAQ